MLDPSASEQIGSEMDHVFTMRFWLELDGTDARADEWRVRIRYVNLRREYHVQGVENAFELVRSLLAKQPWGPQ